jgi:hypothetical protein
MPSLQFNFELKIIPSMIFVGTNRTRNCYENEAGAIQIPHFDLIPPSVNPLSQFGGTMPGFLVANDTLVPAIPAGYSPLTATTPRIINTHIASMIATIVLLLGAFFTLLMMLYPCYGRRGRISNKRSWLRSWTYGRLLAGWFEYVLLPSSFCDSHGSVAAHRATLIQEVYITILANGIMSRIVSSSIRSLY